MVEIHHCSRCGTSMTPIGRPEVFEVYVSEGVRYRMEQKVVCPHGHDRYTIVYEDDKGLWKPIGSEQY